MCDFLDRYDGFRVIADPKDASSRFNKPVDLLSPLGRGASPDSKPSGLEEVVPPVLLVETFVPCKNDVARRFENAGSLLVKETDRGRRCLENWGCF